MPILLWIFTIVFSWTLGAFVFGTMFGHVVGRMNPEPKFNPGANEDTLLELYKINR